VQEEKKEYSLNKQAYIDDILKRKEEALKELYTTGKYKGIYGKKYSKSKANPIKHYIGRWLRDKGWSRERIDEEMQDYYNELFVEVWKMKLHRWPELLNNIEHLTRTICLIVKRHLFRDVTKIYPSAKSYYEKNKRFSSEDKDIKRVNHSELFENDDEYIIEDDQVRGFEKKYSINVDDFIEMMTAEQKELFYSYVEKKGTGKKGRFNNADRAKYNEILEQVTRDCKDILKRINS